MTGNHNCTNACTGEQMRPGPVHLCQRASLGLGLRTCSVVRSCSASASSCPLAAPTAAFSSRRPDRALLASSWAACSASSELFVAARRSVDHRQHTHRVLACVQAGSAP